MINIEDWLEDWLRDNSVPISNSGGGGMEYSETRIGDRVRIKENDIYMSQSNGRIGTIINEATVDGWVKVRWDFGQGVSEESYPISSLDFLTRGNGNVYIPGNTVRLVKDSEYYYQAPDLLGTVRSNSGTWYIVDWSDGSSNSYHDIDLVRVYEASNTSIVGERGDNPESTYLIPGQIIILPNGDAAVVLPFVSEINNILVDGNIQKSSVVERFISDIMVLNSKSRFDILVKDIKEVTQGFVDLSVYEIRGDSYETVLSSDRTSTNIKYAMSSGLSIEYVGEFSADLGVELLHLCNNEE